MHITPVIPDGYNGPIKQLTCRICQHLFYITQADYHRLQEVLYCHECSLILAEELQKAQGPNVSTPSKETSPASLPLSPAFRASQAIHVPRPRTIDREKMTVEQLLEEAKMLRKTWRYKEALSSYEEVLERSPECLAAHYGRCKMLRALSRPREALLAYDELLQLDPASARAYNAKAWVLVDLRRYEEALAAFDHALQLIPTRVPSDIIKERKLGREEEREWERESHEPLLIFHWKT